MDIIYNKKFLEHNQEDHPENAKRLSGFSNLKNSRIENAEQYLKLVHTKEYIDYIKKSSEKQTNIDSDTYTTKKTYGAACFAVGASVLASETNSFALTRPPGHHTFRNKGSGFCIFNNIAIASQRLVNQGKKVFILDFDCHHGNGAQSIFYGSDKVLYLSTHQYPAYPGTGWVDEIGEGTGKGYNINIPLPQNSGDDLFDESFQFFIPIIKEKFKPDIVAVSAGFDAHYSDPLTKMNISLNSFYSVGKLLRENFRNIFAVLEGGYNPEALTKGVYNFIDGINNKKMRYDDKITSSGEKAKKDFQLRFIELKKNLKGYIL